MMNPQANNTRNGVKASCKPIVLNVKGGKCLNED